MDGTAKTGSAIREDVFFHVSNVRSRTDLQLRQVTLFLLFVMNTRKEPWMHIFSRLFRGQDFAA